MFYVQLSYCLTGLKSFMATLWLLKVLKWSHPLGALFCTVDISPPDLEKRVETAPWEVSSLLQLQGVGWIKFKWSITRCQRRGFEKPKTTFPLQLFSYEGSHFKRTFHLNKLPSI